jgi:hypothetical protein
LFLNEGKPRYRKQLNNAAEQMNSVIRDLRHQPILDIFVGLSRWIIGKSFERREMSKKWIELGYRLTEFAQAHHIKWGGQRNIGMSQLQLTPSPAEPVEYLVTGSKHVQNQVLK